MLSQKCSYKRVSSSRNSLKRCWQVQVSGNWVYCWTEWISIFRTLMKNWWIHKSANKRSRWKKVNYMGLSELMRMIIIFVTFCLNKKKSHKDSKGKNIQINFKKNYYLSIWLCWVFVSVWGLPLAAASRGHSSSQCTRLSLSWPLLLRSTGSRCVGSVVVAHGPSCSVACGIFLDQGSNPCPLH